MARHIMLFDGADAAGNQGPWVSNGTAAGTSELTGIGRAFTGGIDTFYSRRVARPHADLMGKSRAGQGFSAPASSCCAFRSHFLYFQRRRP